MKAAREPKVTRAKAAPAEKPTRAKAPAEKVARRAEAPVAEAAPKKTRGARREAAASEKGIRRRDAGGRPDAEYVADLLAKSGRTLEEGDDKAFLDRPESDDPFAEERGEDFIQSATSGEGSDEAVLDPSEPAPEESGFVITTGKEEFGREPDESNPEDAEVEPFPTTRSES